MQQRKHKKEDGSLIKIFTPPPPVNFVVLRGRTVLGVPVYDNRSATMAMGRMKDTISNYVSDNFGQTWSPDIDLEKFFELAVRFEMLLKDLGIEMPNYEDE